LGIYKSEASPLLITASLRHEKETIYFHTTRDKILVFCQLYIGLSFHLRGVTVLIGFNIRWDKHGCNPHILLMKQENNYVRYC